MHLSDVCNESLRFCIIGVDSHHGQRTLKKYPDFDLCVVTRIDYHTTEYS